nr:MAG TPA: hypothetical protein [Bacteriophage sp.]
MVPGQEIIFSCFLLFPKTSPRHRDSDDAGGLCVVWGSGCLWGRSRLGCRSGLFALG